jgi:hypothetical protein|nr:MAG TPA: Scaffold protein [Microviridae sp.]
MSNVLSRFSPSIRCYTSNNGVTLTVQDESIVNQCDINKLCDNYIRTGEYYPGILARKLRRPIFGDFNPVQQTLENVLSIQRRSLESFDMLPPEIRERFNNDPRKFFDFVTDVNNQDEIIKMGLATDTRVPEAIQKVEIVNPEPAKGSE